MSNTALQQAFQIAKTEDVSTPANRVVLYSISYLPTPENKQKALEFIRNNPDYMLLDDTKCGKRLINLGLETGNENPPQEIMKIWAIASKRFIAAAKGNITAFVEGADSRSTFVSAELPEILKNPGILTINNKDKFLFAESFGVK